jgi:hypothetical protein
MIQMLIDTFRQCGIFNLQMLGKSALILEVPWQTLSTEGCVAFFSFAMTHEN